MKEDDDYKPPPEIRETTMKKYKEVLDARLRVNLSIMSSHSLFTGFIFLAI